MNKPLKVLHFITGLGRGGAEYVILNLCKKSIPEQVEMYVLAFGTRDELVSLYQQEGIQVNFIPVYSKKKILDVLKSLIYTIREKKIDVLHVHLFHAMLIASMVKLINPRLPICFTSHSNIGSNLREFILFCLRPFRSVDVIFSKLQHQYFNLNNTVVIQNGIETTKYELETPRNHIFTFLNIARLEEVKNHLELVKIVKKIQSLVPFQVWIAGQGHLSAEIQKSIEKEGLTDKIHLLGFRSDIIQLCNQAHAFILPSIWEGMPIALIEAGAAGLIVISTPVGSIPSMINESNGYLPTIENFGATMQYVLEHPEEAREKAKNLQKNIQMNYDVKVMYDHHIDLYKRLAK